jgi:hypothetical protein
MKLSAHKLLKGTVVDPARTASRRGSGSSSVVATC